MAAQRTLTDCTDEATKSDAIPTTEQDLLDRVQQMRRPSRLNISRISRLKRLTETFRTARNGK
jgi:hypothetical protein